MDFLRLEIQSDKNLTGVSMFHSVGYGLLTDAKEMVTSGRRKTPCSTRDANLGLNRCVGRELPGHLRHSLDQVVVFQVLRIQLQHGTACLDQVVFDELPSEAQVLLGFCRRLEQTCCRGFQMKQNHSKALFHGVV